MCQVTLFRWLSQPLVIRRFRGAQKLYKNILKVGDNCFAGQIVDDFLLTNQALDEDREDFFLKTKVFPKRYSKELANKIHTDLKQLQSYFATI